MQYTGETPVLATGKVDGTIKVDGSCQTNKIRVEQEYRLPETKGVKQASRLPETS